MVRATRAMAMVTKMMVWKRVVVTVVRAIAMATRVVGDEDCDGNGNKEGNADGKECGRQVMATRAAVDEKGMGSKGNVNSN